MRDLDAFASFIMAVLASIGILPLLVLFDLMVTGLAGSNSNDEAVQENIFFL